MVSLGVEGGNCADSGSLATSVVCFCTFGVAGVAPAGLLSQPSQPEPVAVEGRWTASAEGGEVGGWRTGSGLSAMATSSCPVMPGGSGFVVFPCALPCVVPCDFACKSSALGPSLGVVEPFSGILGRPTADSENSLMLAESEDFFVSYRLKSGIEEGFEVSPRIVSLATWVEAEDLGARGHDPYQLRALCTW